MIITKSLNKVEVDLEGFEEVSITENKVEIIKPTIIFENEQLRVFSPKLLPTNGHAQQGVCVLPDGKLAVTENYDVLNTAVVHRSRISIVSADLTETIRYKEIIRDVEIWSGVTNYNIHLGQINYHVGENRLYVFVMNTAVPQGAPNRSALLQLDLNLNITNKWDLSSIFPYVDGLAFDEQRDKFYLDYGVLIEVNFTNFKSNPSGSPSFLQRKKFDYRTDLFSTSQGLQVKDGYLYAVPENDSESYRTKAGYTGVIRYKISDLVKRPYDPIAEDQKIKNMPTDVFYLALPSPDNIDLEAMSFLVGKDKEFYISTAANAGDRLWKVQIK